MLATEVFLPHAAVFGWVVMVGQLLAGLAILCGGFTSAALLGGLFMNLNFLIAEAPEPRAFYIAIQALLGCALRDASRWALLRECWQLAVKRGPYARSREELTPLRWDWPSALPVIVTALWLLVNPKAAHYLPEKGWGSHLLNPESIRKIRRLGGEQPATVNG